MNDVVRYRASPETARFLPCARGVSRRLDASSAVQCRARDMREGHLTDASDPLTPERARDESATRAIVVFLTAPASAPCDELAAALVEARLAACVQRLPAVQATYMWKGKVEKDTEVLLLIKTTVDRFEALRDHVVEWHPYDVPQIVACEITRAFPPYLAWVVEQTRA